MGLRLRKSIKLGKHTRLNLSKSGVGVSTGVKGFRVGVGPKGVRTTASIPGTGISHTTQHSMKPKRKSTLQKTTQKVPIMARDMGDGKLSIEVYGEQIREQRADKPVKLTQSDYNKGMKIAKRHMRTTEVTHHLLSEKIDILAHFFSRPDPMVECLAVLVRMVFHDKCTVSHLCLNRYLRITYKFLCRCDDMSDTEGRRILSILVITT